MKPRGRPFPPGNKMGRGRPKGSRNKSKSAVQELLEQAYLPLVSMFIRQAFQGEFSSQEVVLDLIQSLPHKRSIRSGNMQNAEDLLKAGEATMQQMDRGEITTVEAKTKMQGIEQMGQLLEQREQEKESQQLPKDDLPEFMRIDMELDNAERLEKLAKARQEREALEWAAANPSAANPSMKNRDGRVGCDV